jgi:hypothetical protein
MISQNIDFSSWDILYNAEAYLYKMAPVERIQIAPPLKYLKLRLLIINLLD